MDGFFDKYGRVIIVAVVVCFVLLLFTPMKRTIGDNINGFVDGFANKAGESLGTVKMPDGSDNIAKEKSSMLIKGKEFNSKIPSEATTVIFTDEKAPKGVATTDLTVAKDGDVVGWLDGTTWKVSTQAPNKAVTFNENCYEMLANTGGRHELPNLVNISLNNVDTSNVTDMGYMFARCENLKELDLSGFDTTKVTNMWGMFSNCSKLAELNLNSFNTQNVTDMGYMFLGCSNLTSLDLSGFDTSNVTNMDRMFYYCLKLTSLDLSNFNTSKVTDMDSMFCGCSNLQTVKARSQTDIDKLKTKSTKVDSSVKFEIA